jgi:hypothetical protein
MIKPGGIMWNSSRPTISCDIFIRSYYKDFQWLRYSLRSIEKYCRGFSKVVVVVPESSRQKLDWLGLAGDLTFTCNDQRDDYLGQQVTKLTADLFSEADFICHVDSDCVFRQPTTPQSLFEKGKPRVLMAPYDRLDSHIPWRGLVEQVLRRPVEYEFMRMPPYTFPRWIYNCLREHVASLHGISLEDLILAQPPRGFSEFNVLGAYAFYHHPEKFHWLDVAAWPSAREHCRTFWSWGGIDETVRQELEQILV